MNLEIVPVDPVRIPFRGMPPAPAPLPDPDPDEPIEPGQDDPFEDIPSPFPTPTPTPTPTPSGP